MEDPRDNQFDFELGKSKSEVQSNPSHSLTYDLDDDLQNLNRHPDLMDYGDEEEEEKQFNENQRQLISPTHSVEIQKTYSYSNSFIKSPRAGAIQSTFKQIIAPSNAHVSAGIDKIKSGLSLGVNSKFDVRFFEAVEKLKIPLYGCENCREEFEVSQPQMINNKFIAYHVSGVDKLGSFEGRRRYNEFYLIRACISQRWPGIFIPALPPKKAVGNKDVKFIIERRYFLERFIKQLSKIQYIVNQEEFRIFARPEFTGGHSDIEKQIQKLPKIYPDQLATRYKEAFNIQNYEEFKSRLVEQMDEAELKIREMDNFLKKVITQYKLLRKQLKGLIEIKSAQIDNQKNLLGILGKYEEKSLSYYTDQNNQKMILADKTNDLFNGLIEMTEKMKNPFTNLYYWVKGEILDIVAFQETLLSRANLHALIVKTGQKKKEQLIELDKVAGGKTMLKTLFKSTNEKQNYQMTLQKQLEVTDDQIQDLTLLYQIIAWNLSENTISQFKKEKIDNFSKILREMASIEIENSNVGANYWSRVLSNSNLKHF